MTLQTVLFPKNKWKLDDAKRWLMDHNHRWHDVDETEHMYRFRQQEPHGGHYYTITLPNKVELVYAQ